MSVEIPRTLETKDGTCLLRQLRVDDADTVCRLVAAPGVSQCSRLVPPEPGEKATANWIRQRLDRDAAGNCLTWAVITKDRGILVGVATLTVNQENRAAEVDFWIGEPFRQQGHGRAVLETLREFSFATAGWHRLELRHVTTESTAEALALSLGFIPEGVARHQWKLFGTFLDIAQYGLLETD
jgi:RimJ/RimL family protein N-acetyltransferase